MNIVTKGWIIFLALISSISSSFAGTATQGELIIGVTKAVPVHLTSPLSAAVTRQRILIPEAAVQMFAVQATKAGKISGPATSVRSMHLSRVLFERGHLVLVGHRLVSHGVDSRGIVPVWLEEVRVTMPRQFLANSWDVLSLQRELERLGIKVKPKPVAPRPTSQMSG